MTRTTCMTITVILLAATSATGGGSTTRFIPLSDLPGGDFSSFATSLSSNGTTVVGRSISSPPDGFSQPFEAFRWTGKEGLVGLGDLDGGIPDSFALAVSGNGAVIVGLTEGGPPFKWTQAGGMEPFEDGTGAVTFLRPTAISANGNVIAGTGTRAGGGNVMFRWTQPTGVVDLGALPTDHPVPDAITFDISNNGGTIVGGSLSTIPDVEPVIWTESSGLVGLGDVPGGAFYALGEAVSADGSWIGGSARTTFGTGRDEGFLWNENAGFVFTDPQRGENGESVVSALSRDGSVAVGFDTNLPGGAMIWDPTNGRRSIASLLESSGIDLTGWLLGSARDISADGTVIVGNGINPDGNSEAWLAILPRRGAPVPAADFLTMAILAGFVFLTGFFGLKRA